MPNTFCLFAHMPNALQSFAGGIRKLPRSSPGKQGPSFCQHPRRRAGTELMLPANCSSFEMSAKTLGCLMPLGRKLSSEAQFNSSAATEPFAVARLLPQFPHWEKNVSMSFTQLSWALKGHPLLNHIVWKQRNREMQDMSYPPSEEVLTFCSSLALLPTLSYRDL